MLRSTVMGSLLASPVVLGVPGHILHLIVSVLFFVSFVSMSTELHPMVSCEEVANVLVRLRDGSRLLVQLAAGLPHCYQSSKWGGGALTQSCNWFSW